MMQLFGLIVETRRIFVAFMLAIRAGKELLTRLDGLAATRSRVKLLQTVAYALKQREKENSGTDCDLSVFTGGACFRIIVTSSKFESDSSFPIFDILLELKDG